MVTTQGSRTQHRALLSVAPALLLLADGVAAPLWANDSKHFASLSYRFIGPAIMGGRATDVEGVAGDPNVVYAGFGGGGLWKTTNGGHTWTPIFEKQGTYSIGDFALEPNNSEVIWVGTGESNTRNSVSFGDGVYRSTDGGKTWKHLGLRETERISRILIHPTNPRTAWVGALGHAFGPHSERGVFVTSDGGASWQKTLYFDDRHGVSDMDLNPANPNILYAALWYFDRKPWTHTSGSAQGGVFRSIDGGRTWNKLTKGLPKLLGRIGVKVAPSNPNTVYIIAESKEGTLFRSDDGGDTFTEVTRNKEIVSRGFYYSDLRVDPGNENKLYAIATNLWVSIDAGKTWKSIVNGTHIDYHALWINPSNPRHMWNGNDGGIAYSNDAGATWEPVYNIPQGQFYQLHADNRLPFYYVMGGLQDNGSWSGPARTREPAGILNDDWRMVQFGDGFHMFNHPDDPDVYLSEAQGGTVARTDMRTREAQLATPYPISVTGGSAEEAKFRFNWNAPLVSSAHHKDTVYLGSNVLFRSTDFGRTWKAISPDLTSNDKSKQKAAGGPLWLDNSTAEYHCTIISIGESPLRAGDLWTGSDDGKLHRSTNGGADWTDLTGTLKDLPVPFAITHIEPSRTSPDVAYLTAERHMFDDFQPYIYRTPDGGKSWKRITNALPDRAYLHVLREDPRNARILYAGTEIGLYVSWNEGATWFPLNAKNLPPVAIHDIRIHSRENDLILATHGRSVAVLDDIAAIQQLANPQSTQLFPPRPSLRYAARFTRYGLGGAVYKGPNPPYGSLLTYFLPRTLDEKANLKLQILDGEGKMIRELSAIPREAGVQRVAWDLKTEAPAARKPPTEFDQETGRTPKGWEVLPGAYRIRLIAADQTLEQNLEVRLDPTTRTPESELQLRLETASRLWKHIDEGNKALKQIDSLRSQLEQTNKLVKIAKLDDYKRELSRIESQIARPSEASRLEAAPGLLEKLEGLFATVEGANAAPTEAMQEALAGLEPQFTQRLAEVKKFLGSGLTSWNEDLRRLGAPSLIVQQ